MIYSIAPLISALELLKNAIAKAGYTDKIVIGMDVAASEFYKDGKYDLDFKSPDDPSRYISADQLADIYRGFVKDYPGGVLAPEPFQEIVSAAPTRSKWGNTKITRVFLKAFAEVVVNAASSAA